MTTCEYLWIGEDETFQHCHNNDIINITKKKFFTKTRTIDIEFNDIDDIKQIPLWSFDGSSTGHILDSNHNTDIILVPVYTIYHPFKDQNHIDFLVLCETYLHYNNENDCIPHPSNHRKKAVQFFECKEYLQILLGLEQEFLFMNYNNLPVSFEYTDEFKQGTHYCNTSITHKYLRPIMEELYHRCLKLDIKISGFNAEVMPCQWEFQIGPECPESICDDLTIARFILERISEKYNYYINYHSKPFPHLNGSGCHHNFSTNITRNLNQSNYNAYYENLFKLFETNHTQTMKSYGTDNHYRLTGIHETSSLDVFNYGIGTRNTSIRIPLNVYEYAEDRRPSSSIDPYLSCKELIQLL